MEYFLVASGSACNGGYGGITLYKTKKDGSTKKIKHNCG